MSVSTNGRNTTVAPELVPPSLEAALAAAEPLGPFAYDPAHGITDHGIVVDHEFRRLLPPHTQAERAELEQQLQSDGICLQPLVVWNGPNLLLDGHKRLEYCIRWGIPFRKIGIDLAGWVTAMDWVLAHQGGRRNLTKAGWSLVRGYACWRSSLKATRAGGNNDWSGPSGCH